MSKFISKTIAQYNDLWADAVVSAGKKDCIPSLVLLDNIDYYRTSLLNNKIVYNENNKLYSSLHTVKDWKRLTIEEKMYFYADVLNGEVIKAPYILPEYKRSPNLLDTSVQSYNFGDYIIKTKDSNGNEVSERTLISFNCIAFSLQLDTNKIFDIKKYAVTHQFKQADYIRRVLMPNVIKQLKTKFQHEIQYMFVIEDNKRTCENIHIHGMMNITAEDLSIKAPDSKRRFIETCFLKAALGKNYQSHPLIKFALEIVLPYHPLGWVSYMCKSKPHRKDIYISDNLRKSGENLYNEYRNTVKALKDTQKRLKKS